MTYNNFMKDRLAQYNWQGAEELMPKLTNNPADMQRKFTNELMFNVMSEIFG